MNISISELEQAINYWRNRRPSSGDECTLSIEVDTLATPYALMIFERKKEWPAECINTAARDLIAAWKTQQGR